MNKKDIKAINPHELGWLEYKLNPQEMDYLWRCVKNKKGDEKKNLAGNISGSYGLQDRSDWFYRNTLKPLILQYSDEFINIGRSVAVNQTHPYYLEKWWVNYQQQTEFNPLHCHKGVYSFVIWMKIPFSFAQQNKKKIASNSNTPRISAFEFNYSNMLGEMREYMYELNPTDEGFMLFFPAKLHHQVFPFYDCDEDRISISGNITLNTTKIM